MQSTPQSRSRRALQIFGGLHLGGAEVWATRAADTLEAAGWQVDFCLLDRREGPLAERMRRRGRRVLNCPAAPLASFPARFLRLLSGEKYAVVHSHVLLFSGVVTALAAAAGVPLRLVQAHNSLDGRSDAPSRQVYRWAMRWALRAAANRAVAVSEEARVFLGRDAEWLPCGVDLEPLAAPPDPRLRSELGLRAGAFVIGHVGRLASAKNQALLLDAFALARKAGADFQLVIAGDGPLRGELLGRARRLGVWEDVRLLGARDDVARLMSGAFDAFAMPSLHEGLPLAAVEAQAVGLPCLLSDRIGRQTDAVPELIERLPIEAGAQGWARALSRLPEREGRSAASCRAAVRAAGLDLESSSRRLLEIYEAAAPSGSASRWAVEAARAD